MSILPLLLDLAEGFSSVGRQDFDDDFAFGIHPHEFKQRKRTPNRFLLTCPGYPRHCPYALSTKHHTPIEKFKRHVDAVGKDGFQVSMDVQQFKPNELTVKTVDNCVVVEGKHEEREDDHGHISRHFVRKYTLPKDYDPKDVVSALSSDGVLTIKVPQPNKTIKGNERIVQIQQTGPAHLSVKENKKVEIENGEKNCEKDNKMEG